MINITENSFFKDPSAAIQRLLAENEILKVVSDKKSVVIIDEKEWNNIRETIYLNSFKGYPETIIAASNEDLKESLPIDQLDW